MLADFRYSNENRTFTGSIKLGLNYKNKDTELKSSRIHYLREIAFLHAKSINTRFY